MSRSDGIALAIMKGASLSKDRRYRYVLWRVWSEGDGYVCFIGLNPSTADENQNDPTIRRCIGFAKEWGFGGMYMLNLFAFRATRVCDLKKADDSIGPENNQFLSMYIDSAGSNIACWGTNGLYKKRGQYIMDRYGDNLQCFGLTKNGQPKHPLYLPKASTTEYISMYGEIKP